LRVGAVGLALEILAVATVLNFAVRGQQYRSLLDLFDKLGLAGARVWVRLSGITEQNSKGTVYDVGGTR
jgi:hypothetical protein